MQYLVVILLFFAGISLFGQDELLDRLDERERTTGRVIAQLVDLLAGENPTTLAIIPFADEKFMARLNAELSAKTPIKLVDKSALDTLIGSQYELSNPELFDGDTIARMKKFQGFAGWSDLLKLRMMTDDDGFFFCTFEIEAKLYRVSDGELRFTRLIESRQLKLLNLSITGLVVLTILLVSVFVAVKGFFVASGRRSDAAIERRRIEQREELLKILTNVFDIFAELKATFREYRDEQKLERVIAVEKDLVSFRRLIETAAISHGSFGGTASLKSAIKRDHEVQVLLGKWLNGWRSLHGDVLARKTDGFMAAAVDRAKQLKVIQSIFSG